MTLLEPPVATRRTFDHTEHGVVRPDPYAWMGTASAELTQHLAAERAFYEAATEDLHDLASDLRAEMESRVPSSEVSPKWRRTRCSYYTRRPDGSDYAQLWREILHSEADSTSISPVEHPPSDGNRSDASPELLLDFGSLADDSGYLDLGLTLVSPDEHLLAYSVDTTGDEVFTLRFRDLRTGTDLADEIPRSYYGGAWSADSTWFFYSVHDESYRPHEIWRHHLGTSASDDVLVLTEPDERFELHLRTTRSEDLVVIVSESRDTGETWVVDAHHPDQEPRSVGGRRAGVIYHAEHVRDGAAGALLVLTDDGAVESRLMRCPVPRDSDQDHTAWTEVRAEDPAARLERIDAFAGGLVLSYRSEHEPRLRLLPSDDPGAEGVVLRSRFVGGAVHLARNTAYDVTRVTLVDQAHLQPRVWSEVDLATGRGVDVLTEEAPKHDPALYVTERRLFASSDGVEVPATLLRHRDTPLDGTAPALLYGYGAYEAVDDPAWDSTLPSLLDRGVVFVQTHIRGGGEGGRRWWLDGRMEHKQHTFSDHIAVADGLAGLVDADRIATRGLSAGGLLQGAVFSQRPDRWRAVVAEVPFVDVVTTMFDASIPLTVNEWDEWGDPHRRADFDWMRAYSPYENLPPAGGRPDLLVTGAVHDPRVMVREPAKWVAALRESDPEWSPRCVFRCELGAGSHVGPSGRFGALAYEAEILAWVLDRLGVDR